MDKRNIRRAGMALLAGVMTLGLARSARAIDLSDGSCSLTIKLVSDEQVQDITGSEAVYAVDLYRVARAVADPAFETYSYEMEEGFAFEKDGEAVDMSAYEDLVTLTNDDYKLFANQAAEVIYSDIDNHAPTYTSADGIFKDIDPGLYMVIAHGDEDPYYEKDEEGNWTAILNSDEYVYTYKPELISLPSTVEDMTGAYDEEGQFIPITTAGGEWIYDLKATLKPSQEVRYGDLWITKTYTGYDTWSPVTCVFHITAELKDKVVYDNYVAMTFDSADTETVKLAGKLPVNAVVTVTEEYAGAGYRQVGVTPRPVVIPVPVEDGHAEVTFENTRGDEVIHGYGIENHFEYNGTSWDLDNKEEWKKAE